MSHKHHSRFVLAGVWRTLAALLIGGLLSVVVPLSWTPAGAQATMAASQPHSAETALLPSTLHLPLVARNQDPTLPLLISPSDGAQLDTLAPLFVFEVGEQPPNTIAAIDYSTDPDPDRPIWGGWYLGVTSGARLEWASWFNLEPSTTYYWRVGFIYDRDYEHPSWTEQYAFITAPAGGELLPPPALVSPADGTVLAADNVVLQWAPVSGAVEYRVAVNDLDSGLIVLYRTPNTSATFTGHGIIEPGDHYEWSVAARNDYGWGPDSEDPWDFTIAPSAHPLSQTAGSGVAIRNPSPDFGDRWFQQ